MLDRLGSGAKSYGLPRLPYFLCQTVEALKTPVVSMTFQAETRTPSTKTTRLAPLSQIHTPRTPQRWSTRLGFTTELGLHPQPNRAEEEKGPDKQSSQPKKGTHRGEDKSKCEQPIAVCGAPPAKNKP